MNVELLETCASDLAVVNAARVSFAQEHDVMEEGDDKLVGFLLRERHGSPFEHGYFRFRVDAPIFVFREWHRHRAGHSYNEVSGRYVELEERFYTPLAWRTQVGKPGHYTYEGLPVELEHDAWDRLAVAYEDAWGHYQALLAFGVAKEQARMVLPLGIYSQMIWSCNPRSLMHFLSLRNAPNAQAEIRELAAKVEGLVAPVMPVTLEAFRANERRAP